MTKAVCPLCRSSQNEHEMQWNEYAMVKCASCGLVFADPLEPPPHLYHQAYEDPTHCYKGYLDRAEGIAGKSYHVAWAWRHFFNRATPPANARLVDVGCSTGIFMAAAKDRGWSPEGVEISPPAVEAARRSTGATVHEGTLEGCKFASASFDAVTSWEVLEHVTEPTKFAAEVFRILKPGGWWAISVPNWNSPWERATTEITRRPPYHVTYWRPPTIERLLRESKFEAVTTKQKLFAWTEEVGSKKFAYLPVALFRSFVLGQKANRLFALGRKPA